MIRPRAVLLLVGLLAAPAAGPLAKPGQAQQRDLRTEIQESQRRLEQIRAERERLEREMAAVQSQVRDVAVELANVERRLSGSRSVLTEIQFQSDLVAERLDANNRDLIQARDQMREGSATLRRRLRDIYKMGRLHTVRVLLGADSFGDLLNRYRYLRMIASYDRSLIDRISRLEGQLVVQDRQLQSDLAELGRLREARTGEVAELRSLEEEHQVMLTQFRTRERQALSRLELIEADETRMSRVIDDLETQRREAELRTSATAVAPPPPAPTMAASDAGTLAWPVEGPLVYRFGRERRPNGTVLRWNGVGIGAAPGTPVRAVKAGTVVMAGPFEGYGPTVVLSHGEGFYTLYLYLEDVSAVEGRRVEAGEVVGTVGGADTPEGPHLEFQVRAPQGGGSPQAQDPLAWLSAQPQPQPQP
jgi:septal ring factor EnvC (AmiA/AmiB activator)